LSTFVDATILVPDEVLSLYSEDDPGILDLDTLFGPDGMEYAEIFPYLLEGPSGEDLVLEWRGQIYGCASHRPIVAFTALSSEYNGSEIFDAEVSTGREFAPPDAVGAAIAFDFANSHGLRNCIEKEDNVSIRVDLW
jgi:hypothetical protein